MIQSGSDGYPGLWDRDGTGLVGHEVAIKDLLAAFSADTDRLWCYWNWQFVCLVPKARSFISKKHSILEWRDILICGQMLVGAFWVWLGSPVPGVGTGTAGENLGNSRVHWRK